MCPNDQRLFDQKAVDVVVTPHNSEILPVHVVTGRFFVFGNRRGVIDVFLSFGRRMETLSNVVCVSHHSGQCYGLIADSRRSS